MFDSLRCCLFICLLMFVVYCLWFVVRILSSFLFVVVVVVVVYCSTHLFCLVFGRFVLFGFWSVGMGRQLLK